MTRPHTIARTFHDHSDNMLIADTFHRLGAIEAWGRGMNRVIEECQRAGLEPPVFREEAGMLIMTFKARIGPSAGTQHQGGGESISSGI